MAPGWLVGTGGNNRGLCSCLPFPDLQREAGEGACHDDDTHRVVGCNDGWGFGWGRAVLGHDGGTCCTVQNGTKKIKSHFFGGTHRANESEK